MTPWTLTDFLRESLHIEGIEREPTAPEFQATAEFLAANHLSTVRIKALVAVYAPHAVLRDRIGLDVRVGTHIAPPGGPNITERLRSFCDRVNGRAWDAYEAHHIYEALHPFTDGNGRSGRAIWLWQQRGHAPIGFLHRWYYDTLQRGRA